MLQQSVVEVAIISDTHMPKGARRLPDACLARLDRADVIIHVGDFSTVDVLRELETHGSVIAVHGNVDDGAVRAELPTSRTVELDGVMLGLIHDAGPSFRRLERLRRRFPDCAGAIFGHSHIPLHERSDGFQIFNPGSPTERRRSPHHTMGIAHVDRSGVTFELVVLD